MSAFKDIWNSCKQVMLNIWEVASNTIVEVFHDHGVMSIFFIAGLVYPFLYEGLCWENTLKEVPIAVVDLSGSQQSKRFLRKVDASHDVKIEYRCTSMTEAEQLLQDQKVHGIMYFPRDYTDNLEGVKGQAHISVYCDMSTFLYMKNILLSSSLVMLDEMHLVQRQRMSALGVGDEMINEFIQGSQYEETKLYNPIDGYASFLIPPVLVLIILQTLFLGLCMLMGTLREEKRLYKVSNNKWSNSIQVNLGLALGFFIIYIGLSCIDLILVPRIFGNIPHIGNVKNLIMFIVPMLLSTIFFSLFIAGFLKNRETGMVVLLPTSLIFLFIAGVSWPQVCIPEAWRHLSYFFPTTWSLHGYLHLNSMGATMSQIAKEFNALWILTAFYFVLAVIQMVVIFRKDPKSLASNN